MSVPTPRKIARFGWKPDLPDMRDKCYKVTHSPAKTSPLPSSVDLTKLMPPVFDQGQLGSCTANALCGAFGLLHPGFIGSRLQLYYNERKIEDDIGQDGGAQIRDGVKVLNQIGVCPEEDWPYIEDKFANAPTAKADADAGDHKCVSYSSLTDRADYRTCLASGHPFVIGITVYDSFESDVVAKWGVVPMPSKSESIVGGHAICIIGYNTDVNGGDYYLARNSWGIDWGLNGNFWIPAAYIESDDLANDAWTLRT